MHSSYVSHASSPETGASSFPCSDTYCGTAAHTEIEVKTVTDYILGLRNVKVFVDFHCYSQYWMVPWGYTKRLPANYLDQVDDAAGQPFVAQMYRARCLPPRKTQSKANPNLTKAFLRSLGYFRS